MRHANNERANLADVSIHASVKDATRRNALLRSSKSGFNPRICKRCDIGSAYIRARKDVSIHASVKDATQ